MKKTIRIENIGRNAEEFLPRFEQEALAQIPSAMSFTQVMEQYDLAFDDILSFDYMPEFQIVLTERNDLEEDDAPENGQGWANWKETYNLFSRPIATSVAYNELSVESRTLINWALKCAGDHMPLRKTPSGVSKQLTIKHRRPLRLWGNTLIIRINGSCWEGGINFSVAVGNDPLATADYDRVIGYFLGVDGCEDIASITLE